MTILDCSMTAPPRIEEGAVVFLLLHHPSGEVFSCRMKSPDDVSLTMMPGGLTPHADGETRGIVAEAALLYARENPEFEPLFAHLPDDDEGGDTQAGVT